MLKTEFICILTSGFTADGRKISEQIVEELAETYDPAVYSARINIEHSEYGAKLGSVLSLKVEDFGDKKKLFAELKPNDFFLYLNQNGQKLHTSAEIVFDFAKTGKAYLTGLAVTDSPASLGTTEIKLSVNGQQAETFSSAEVIEPETKSIFPFKKLFKEDNHMDKAILELMEQMQEQLSKTTDSVQSLVDQVSKLTATPPTTNKEQDKSPTKEPANSESEDLAAVKQQLSELTTIMAEIKEVHEKLSNETDKPFRHQATGGSDQAAEEIL